MGENTLKESVISWLEKKPNNDYMTALLQLPKWMAAFSQDSANEIINSLKKSSDVTGLMNNIFALAAEEGITALNITSDSLRSWIVDVIRQNHIKIVLIWDEFSDFFRQNKDSLGEFQKNRCYLSGGPVLFCYCYPSALFYCIKIEFRKQ